jgi:hypothetical protein
MTTPRPFVVRSKSVIFSDNSNLTKKPISLFSQNPVFSLRRGPYAPAYTSCGLEAGPGPRVVLYYFFVKVWPSLGNKIFHPVLSYFP